MDRSCFYRETQPVIMGFSLKNILNLFRIMHFYESKPFLLCTNPLIPSFLVGRKNVIRVRKETQAQPEVLWDIVEQIPVDESSYRPLLLPLTQDFESCLEICPERIKRKYVVYLPRNEESVTKALIRTESGKEEN